MSRPAALDINVRAIFKFEAYSKTYFHLVFLFSLYLQSVVFKEMKPYVSFHLYLTHQDVLQNNLNTKKIFITDFLRNRKFYSANSEDLLYIG